MNSRRLWNSNQRNKFLSAEASPGIFHRRHHMHVVSSICTQDWEVPLKCPKGFHKIAQYEHFTPCLNMRSRSFKTGKQMLYNLLYNNAYLLLAVMVEGDESMPAIRMANYPAVLAGYWPLLTALYNIKWIALK